MDLLDRYRAVRAQTEALCAPLTAEDHVVQAMPDVSPPKWHLAHTTWFFETFVLGPLGVPAYDPRWAYLFNSYYEAEGPRHPRAQRGELSRPTVAEILRYRAHVDERMLAIDPGPVAEVVELGLHHEQQHQELLLTDLKYNLSRSPLDPAYAARLPVAGEAPKLRFEAFDGGLVEIGHAGEGFAFDNEGPRHRVWLEPFRLASRPATCAEWQAFVDDRGYERPELWLADGWAWRQAEGVEAPLYWGADGTIFTLHGRRERDPHEPVAHVSGYEADAFARWAGRRLPTEAEWEHAFAGPIPADSNFVETGRLHPSVTAGHDAGLLQGYGDVWEWTASAYAPYPGYRPAAGALGEYNGKFMINQLVLRGGSCASPRSHLRATYRNFFYAHQRWQFTGVRLADDA